MRLMIKIKHEIKKKRHPIIYRHSTRGWYNKYGPDDIIIDGLKIYLPILNILKNQNNDQTIIDIIIMKLWSSSGFLKEF